MSPIRDTIEVKDVDIHKLARAVIREFSKAVRAELGSALIKLQLGMKLDFPVSRPMPEVFSGAYELRLRDESGIQRVFYYTKSERGILIFHAFTKKTNRTPPDEIELGRKRLKEMLGYEEK